MVVNRFVSGRKRWLLSVVTFIFVTSLAVGGGAIHADSQTTATPVNTVGSINPPPPTSTPTVAPTAVPATATTPATTAPATATTPATTGSSTSTTATPTGTSAAPATTATSSPAASTPTTSSAPVTASSGNVAYGEQQNSGGGPHNVINVQNRTDNRLRVRGRIQLNHIPGPDVEPVNESLAFGSCTSCQTLAVALQIDLANRNATTVAPQNVAVAANVNCSHCDTVSLAIQYVVPVDDPSQTPDNVRSLIVQMQQQLEAVAQDSSETLSDAEAKVMAVVGQFNDLAQSLSTQRDEKSDDNTPAATVAPDVIVLTPAAGTPVAMRPPETTMAL